MQEYNEMQHLRIMESLGGDTLWSDRFLARHAAIVYFWVLTLVGGGVGGWVGGVREGGAAMFMRNDC